jgi:hypothetical protein
VLARALEGFGGLCIRACRILCYGLGGTYQHHGIMNDSTQQPTTPEPNKGSEGERTKQVTVVNGA